MFISRDVLDCQDFEEKNSRYPPEIQILKKILFSIE